jgi:mutator protein MutT
VTATVVVVAAIVEADDRFLLTRRLPGTHLSGLWEFPGGKIDPGEAHDAALRREIREELAVEIDVGPLQYQTAHTYPERTVELFFYRCQLRGTPQPLLGQEMQWVARSDLPRLGFPPADAELIDLLASGAR